MKTKNRIHTFQLSIVPRTLEELEKEARITSDPIKKAQTEHAIAACKTGENSRLPHALWFIYLRKKKEPLGFAQFCDAPADRETEINLTLYHPENQERYAAQALKGLWKWAFSQDRSLDRVTTWLTRDLSAVRILERAGFERVFESKGLVRYEKHRPCISFLALFMAIGTLVGMLVGYLTKNDPICTALGICAGILPGSLIDSAVRKRRRKGPKNSTPQKFSAIGKP